MPIPDKPRRFHTPPGTAALALAGIDVSSAGEALSEALAYLAEPELDRPAYENALILGAALLNGAFERLLDEPSCKSILDRHEDFVLGRTA